jgi:mono/diheme cytochrome c family protein
VVVLRPPPPAEVLSIPKAEILERRRLEQSNMPAGMLDVLREEEVLDLLAYLLGDPRPRSPSP